MGVNLHEKLSGLRSKNTTSVHLDVLEGFKTLLNAPTEGERILANLFESNGDHEVLNFDALESDKIYHITDIKKLCVDYRLRFLDSKRFNGTFPAEALDAVKEFEMAQGREIKGFKNDCTCRHVQISGERQRPFTIRPDGRRIPLLTCQMG